MCLCVPFQLRVKFCLLILRSLVTAFLSSDDLNELAVSNFNVGDRLGFEATRGTFAHPRRFQGSPLRSFLLQTNSIWFRICARASIIANVMVDLGHEAEPPMRVVVIKHPTIFLALSRPHSA